MYYDWDDFWQFLYIVFCICVIVGIVAAAIVVPIYVSGQRVCATYERLNGAEIQFDYTFWAGCLAKAPNGKWIKAYELMQYYGKLYTLQMNDIGE